MDTTRKESDIGRNVFNFHEMEKRLPKEIFTLIENGVHLSSQQAGVLAEAMKQWAIEKGATHFCHWFQPMTGSTAEKHESFFSPNQAGNIITRFRAKELLKGEPDASSFPNGGIRATFEARGYTAWDSTSFAFLKDNTLCIPTAFFSFSGEALDKKTPLLKSNQALNKQAKRILKLFCSDAQSVNPKVGAEQEYFLIDKAVFLKRKDLIFTGRTLLGSNPPKDQQLDDHYFGTLKPRVLKFMRELDLELQKLGIIAKTQHNEVAPSQHELAPSYANCNIACDQNQLTMEMLKKVADKNGMTCLLHEKPFAGINGSGKHINWSILTDTDVNVFEPGNSPEDNALFLLFLSAVLKAVDEFADLLRISVSSLSNDHRLGANEAPPAIVSVSLGNDLESIIDGILNGSKVKSDKRPKLNIGVDALPEFPTDTTDRNRTSPFAFTGNKFEFRSCGSSFSIADPVTVLNTVVAESLRVFADQLEKADDFNTELNNLVFSTLQKHRRVVFGGDGYSKEWILEAKKRGLLNLPTTPDALRLLDNQKNVDLFQRHNIFSHRELESRKAILFENYCKTMRIEGLTLVEMLRREILPSVEKFVLLLTKTAKNKKELSIAFDFEKEKIENISKNLICVDNLSEQLAKQLVTAKHMGTNEEAAIFYRDNVLKTMDEIRKIVDSLENLCPKDLWPMPTYGEILYSVN